MGEDWIQITAASLNVKLAVQTVSAPGAGGIDVFLGTTRSETAKDGRQLVGLQYEAYDEMATEQMRQLARRARERWPIIRLILWHRSGVVPVGEPSVLIAVSTAHRAESFEACKWLIDTLKSEVAIWKKEMWDDGSGTWVDPAENDQSPNQNDQ